VSDTPDVDGNATIAVRRTAARDTPLRIGYLCVNVMAEFHGVTIDGGLADHIVSAESHVPVPRDGSRHGGERLAVALHAVNRVRISPTERVQVIGGGAIGLLCVAVLHDRGAGRSAGAPSRATGRRCGPGAAASPPGAMTLPSMPQAVPRRWSRRSD
jgi:hypothetical protein